MATIVTRAGKGSPLTNTEVDSNFTNLNTDKLETSGGSLTGNLSFGDNDKAIFGAGSDLQIYHSGADSYIVDAGTGDLYIRASNELRVQDGNQSNFLYAVEGGDLRLYHNGSEKFRTTSTGIDVTGTVTADGLTVDGKPVINNTSEYIQLQDLNSAVVSGTDMGGIEWRTADSGVSGANRITARIRAEGNGTFGSTDQAPTNLVFSTHASSGASPVDRLNIASNGDISFYEDTGTTPKFFWDASTERLGIGTDSPDAKLHVIDEARVQRDGVTGESIALRYDGAGAFISARRTNSSNHNPIIFESTNSSTTVERMRIDSSGNVGIGTSSPALPLDVHGGTIGVTSTSAFAGLQITSANNSFAYVNFGDSDDGNIGQINYNHPDNSMKFVTNNAERMRIDSSGQVGIGTSSPDHSLTVQAASGKIANFTNGSQDLVLYCDNSNVQVANSTALTNEKINLSVASQAIQFYTVGSERMRIDSSGNVGIGTTPDSTPSTKLHIREDDSTDYKARMVIQATDHRTIIGSYWQSGVGQYSYIQADNDAEGWYGAPLALQPNGGNVGIGTSSPSAALDVVGDIEVSGGVYLGGASSANLLDDYEEGTWNVTITDGAGNTYSGTYQNRAGRYTKIGRIVQVTFELYVGTVDLPSNGLTGSEAIVLSGLPFNNNGDQFTGGVVSNSNGINYTGDSLGLRVGRNTDDVTIITFSAGTGANDSEVTVTQFNNGNRLVYGTLVYTTA